MPDPNSPDCTAQCNDILQMLIAGCTLPDGQLDQQCVEDVKRNNNFDYKECVRQCEGQMGGVDEKVLACQGQCYDAYASALQGCIRADGSLDPGCVVAKDVAFVDCFVACGDVPWLPDLATCARSCTEGYQQGIAACDVVNGAIEPSCFTEKRGAYNDCLGFCGLSLLRPEDLCVRRCEQAFQAALNECGTAMDPNNIPEPGEQECVAAAQKAYNACLGGCGIKVPDEIRCAGECDLALQVRLAGCEMDAECERVALADYTICLEGCGFAVPPIPEPDPCVSGCDGDYQVAMAQCYDPATGEFDAECLRQADEAYLACLGGCGVMLPEPPPDNNPDCTGPCEVAYQEAVGKCFGPAGANGVVGADGMVDADQECLAAADSAYLRCLEGCGVEQGPIPGDPGFPVGECEQGCGMEILGALFDCAAKNGGVVNIECLARIGDAFNQCLAACREQAGERALGALARTGNRTFLRGDVDLNGLLQITDPIRLLTYLFLGGAEIGCEDAADTNDDGRVNIADASASLSHLFLNAGPLPEPSDRPGTDPTPDALGCYGG